MVGKILFFIVGFLVGTFFGLTLLDKLMKWIVGLV